MALFPLALDGSTAIVRKQAFIGDDKTIQYYLDFRK
jgi:hypothetical protein